MRFLYALKWLHAMSMYDARVTGIVDVRYSGCNCVQGVAAGTAAYLPWMRSWSAGA